MGEDKGNRARNLQRVLVVGGSGGIGRALLREFRRRHPAAELWATHCRSDAPRPEDGDVRWQRLDLADPAQIREAAGQLQRAMGDGGLDALLLASGWLHDTTHGPEKSLRDLDAGAFGRAMAINATGPLLLLSALRSTLRRGRNGSAARVLLLSAKVGSIADNRLGGWYAYRMSKAALNMGVRCVGIELSRRPESPIVSAVHPGTTHTALSEPFSKRGLKVVEPSVTAERLLDFLAAMDARHQGGFFHWDGTPLPG